VTFFNKKEDVLKIELTPHGRRLLAKGKLKPTSYAFFDDDILYDTDNAGFSETNSQAKTRILTETPSIKPQTNYYGVDQNLYDHNNFFETTKYLQMPLGSSNPIEKKTPGWNITLLHGEISSSADVVESASDTTVPIPQINCDIEYKMTVKNISDIDQSSGGLLFSQKLPVVTLQDGTYIDIEEEQLLVNIFERNGFFHKDSYEIEVYMYDEDEVTIDRKLIFKDQKAEVKNDMLILDDTHVSSIDDPQQIHVEYYMDILFDNEIPEEDICSGVRQLRAKDIFLDLEVKCPDREDLDINIYDSRVREEDLEKC